MKTFARSILGTVATAALLACGSDDSGVARDTRAVNGADALVESCTPALPGADGTVPSVETRTLNLWPPNHKFHDISVADCVSVTAATCDSDVRAVFTWASSDEPVDDIGDGHHAPDIELGDDCSVLRLRAERQGPSDGRVYKLGVLVTDALGHAVESECAVIVDHDQRGVVGADSGESYRITFDGTADGYTCSGDSEPPTPPPAEPPADAGPTFIQ